MSDRSASARRLVLAALFTALTAVCAQIQIPLPMVPINLALFAVYLCGALLGAKWGALSMAAYALLGATGAPVFAGFAGGPAVLFGKTGGYILGYIVAAATVGFLSRRWGNSFPKLCAGIALGTAACYALGTAWFMAMTGTGLAASLGYCVLPFLPGDAAKGLLAAFLAVRLREPMRTLGISQAA